MLQKSKEHKFMRKNIVLLFLGILLVSCKGEKEQGNAQSKLLDLTFDNLSIDVRLDSIINSFANSYCDSTTIGFMRVDYKNQDFSTTLVELSTTDFRDTDTPNPPLYAIYYKKKKILLYDDIECFLQSNCLFENIKKKELGDVYWKIKFYNDSEYGFSLSKNQKAFSNETFYYSSYGYNLIENSREILTPTFKNILIDNRVDSILNLFIKESKSENKIYADSCIYKLYVSPFTNKNIDEKYLARKFTLLLDPPSKYSMSRADTPLYILYYQGIRVYLYTRFDKLLLTDKMKIQLPNITDCDIKTKSWTFELNPYAIRIYKNTLDPYRVLFEADWESFNANWKTHKQSWVNF